MITLPEHPSPNAADIALIDYGAFLTPSLGGPVQRINRVGSRFKLSVTLPPLPAAKLGRQWVSRLIRGKSEGVRIELPLLDFNPGFPGAVVVSASGQTGSTLTVSGANPNYVFREGQFFSIETGGIHHLYMVNSEVVGTAGGTATLAITPMLRRQHLINDLCHFHKPMIEGYIDGNEMMWNLSLGNFIGIQFSLSEAQ